MMVVSGNQALSTNTSSWSGKLKSLSSPLWFLCLCFLIVIVVRVWLIVHTFGVMSGEEAMVGLQAEHILRGELPAYYYAQPYMGSLEAYLAALIFRFTGPTVWAMRLETIPMSLLLVYLTWRFAAALADAAHLAARNKIAFMTIAALIAAFPPLYDMAEEMRVQGGYMEAFVIMLWLLLCAFRLTQRWSRQAPWHELALRWVGIGLLVGLGMWIDPLIIYAGVTITIWIGGWFVIHLVKPRREAPWRSRLELFTEGLLVLCAVPALLVGFLPGLIWGAQNNWANVSYIFQLGNVPLIGRLQSIGNGTRLYTTCLAPRAFGGSLPTQPNVTTADPHLVTFGLFVAFVSLALGAGSLLLAQKHPVFVRVLQLTGLSLLFMICVSVIFCISLNSAIAIGSSCGPTDGSGRFVVPLVDVLPFLMATLIILPGIILQEKQSNQVQQDSDEQYVHRFTSFRQSSLITFLQVGLLVVLVLYFGTQGIAYAQADPNYTFQATGCLSRNPTHVDAIVKYLKSNHIQYVWATGWVGDHITFDTNDSIVATKTGGRIVSDDEALMHADRASVLVLAAHNDHHPIFLHDLDVHHVTYRVGRFYSAPGVDVLIVTPLNRTLSPTDPAFSRLFKRSFRGCVL
ncbi:MAG: hypothetical protein ACXWPS_08570 [Ktedonobacteraceae bacterium]